MRDFTGDPKFPIWLIGDSPPEKWATKLDTPLDSRHPTRHSIWTSVADPMQDRLYRQRKLRLDTSRLYIRNASDRPFEKPLTRENTLPMQKRLGEVIQEHKPKIILSFGVSAFMVTLWALDESPQKIFSTTKLLGEQFRLRIEQYDDRKTNVIPLLHASIARGKFLEAHRDFVDGNGDEIPPNYFGYVGEELAELIRTRFPDIPIWTPAAPAPL